MNSVISRFVSAKATSLTEMPDIKLRGKWLWTSRIFWVLLGIAGIAVLINALPQVYPQSSQVCTLSAGECTGNNWLQLIPEEAGWLDRHNVPREVYGWYTTIAVILTSLIMFGLSLLVLWFKSASLSGWLTSLVFLMLGTLGPRQIFLQMSFNSQDAPLPVVIGGFALVFLLWPGLGLWAFTFPDGRFVPGWSWFLWLYWILQVFWYMLPGELQILRWPWYLQVLHYLLMIGSPLLCLIYRYRRPASLIQQQQLKSLIYTLGLVISVVIFSLIFPPGPLILTKPITNGLVYALFPIGVSVAILRYRLWDIDFIINRTLVFTLLTGCVMGLYALIVLVVSQFFGFGENNLMVSLLATGLIAVLFQPLRTGLQGMVNHLLFGRRNEPYAVLTGLGQRLETTIYHPEAVLPELVNSIATSLKLPYVAITLAGQKRIVSEVSTNMSELTNLIPSPVNFALSYQGETVGALLVSPRRGEERLAGRDLQLLKDLARQIGVAVHAVRLTQDLQHSREKLVTTREEERRRLRRDLHDGLGPSLAALNLQAGTIRNLISSNPATAQTLLEEWRAGLKVAIADIRRLVYELRPPALDELGLVEAIREYVGKYANSSDTIFEVAAPEALPILPAAVEVAAYRIVQEALTNVVKHAEATKCQVSFSFVTALTVIIEDNGKGISDMPAKGVGMVSMRERAEELGGNCTIENLEGSGTRIAARLPLPEPDNG